MINLINDLKTQLQELMDSIDDKPTIEKIGKLSCLADNIEAKHTELQNEQKDLLKDYKELIKHTSFTPNGTEEAVEEPKELTFDDFLSAYKK